MQWTPGKSRDGRVETLEDGKPIWVESGCKRYTVSRAVVPPDVVCDAWLRRGEGELPLQLAGGVSSREAITACEEHANGVCTETVG